MQNIYTVLNLLKFENP